MRYCRENLKDMKILLKLSLVIFFFFFIDHFDVFCNEKYSVLGEFDFNYQLNCISISADGYYIAVGCQEKKIYFLNKEGTFLWLYVTKCPINDISMSSDGTYIVAGGNDGTYSIRDGEFYFLDKSGKLFWSVECQGVNSVAISDIGDYRALTTQHWLGWSDQLLLNYKSEWTFKEVLGTHNTSSVAISADGQYIAVGSGNNSYDDGGIHLYNNKGKLLWEYKIPDNKYVGSKHVIAMSQDGQFVVAGNTKGNQIYLLNHKGNLVRQYSADAPIRDVAISGDGKLIALVTTEGQLNILEMEDQKTYLADVENIANVAISRDGNSIIASSKSNKMYYIGNLELYAKAFLNLTEELINQKKSRGIILTEAENLFKSAKQSFQNEAYSKSVQFTEQAKNRAIELEIEAEKANLSLGLSKSTIYSETNRGLIIKEAESLLQQSKSLFEKGDYSRSEKLADQAFDLARKITEEANKANLEMLEARIAMEQGKSEEIILTEGEDSLASAEESYKKGEYSQAYQLANQARRKIELTTREAEEANSLIKKAKNSILNNVKRNVIRSHLRTNLDDLISQAESLYQRGMYSKACVIAQEGLDMSVDVDQDGVLNEDDFAPLVKNEYIYIVLVILSLILTIYIYFILKKQAVCRKIESLDLDSTVKFYFRGSNKK